MGKIGFVSNFTRRVKRYALAGDLNLLDSLRGPETFEHIDELVEFFFETEDWTCRDAVVLLLQDQQDSRLFSLMQTALHSPNIETKIAALRILKKDPSLFSNSNGDLGLKYQTVQLAIQNFQDSSCS